MSGSLLKEYTIETCYKNFVLEGEEICRNGWFPRMKMLLSIHNISVMIKVCFAR